MQTKGHKSFINLLSRTSLLIFDIVMALFVNISIILKTIPKPVKFTFDPAKVLSNLCDLFLPVKGPELWYSL